jgi:hypothetical protein
VICHAIQWMPDLQQVPDQLRQRRTVWQEKGKLRPVRAGGQARARTGPFGQVEQRTAWYTQHRGAGRSFKHR